MSRTVVQAPPWLVRLLTPFVARFVAQGLARKHPGLSREEIGAKMRADVPSGSDPSIYSMIDAVVARLPERKREEAGKSPRLSAVLLVAANLVPLYGVLFWGWEVFALLVLFWIENVIIGVLNVARMLCVDPADIVSWLAKLVFVPFFVLHYGMFTAGHGLFVFTFFPAGRHHLLKDRSVETVLLAIEDFALALPIAVLVASHLFSFLWNYLWRGEFRRATVPGLMMKPYGRVFVLHLTIIVGGMATLALGSPLWALILLIVLKTGVDLRAHVKEHRDPA